MLFAIGRGKPCTRRWAKDWLRSKKHLFRRKKGDTRTAARKAIQNRAHFEEWFAEYAKIKRENDIPAAFEWNADESGFRVGVLRGYWVWTYIDIDKPIQTDSDVRTLVTVMEACSAAGETVPPLVILPGVNLTGKFTRNSLEDDTLLAFSPNGYIDDQIALEWLDQFELLTRPANNHQKRLLLMDNHGSHLTFEFWNRCEAANIILFPLPPHSTHKLQPLDVGIFQLYKHYHQAHLQHMIEKGVLNYDKPEFLKGLHKVRKRAMRPRLILSAWAKCGLVPYKPAVVLDALEDPLSSALNPEAIVNKPGYIAPPLEELDDSDGIEGEKEDREEEGFEHTTPDLPKYIDWSQATTPPLDLHAIREFSDYIDARLTSCIANATPPSPTLAKVIDKRNKATQALMLFGIHAAEDMRRQRRLELGRKADQSDSRVVMKLGPITAGDARLRKATDEYGRMALKKTEAERLEALDRKRESAALHRWLREFKAARTKELKQWKSKLRTEKVQTLAEITAKVKGQLDKLQDTAWLVARYREERLRRHDIYHKAVKEERQRQALKIGRPLEEVPMPWDTHMEVLKPVTPWNFVPMVDEVIAGFMKSGIDIQEEEFDDDDIIDVIEDEIIVVG